MATYLMVQGMEPVELAENFNKVRRRLNSIARGRITADTEGLPDNFNPFAQLSFKTAEGGRFSVNYEKVIGVGSDEARDVGSSSGDDDSSDENDGDE